MDCLGWLSELEGTLHGGQRESQTQATVTATSEADSSKSATAAVTINPSQGGQGLQIATSGLLQGQQNESYSAEFTATGGTQPYSWSVTSGSLPQASL